ncbi:peptide ABC transporter substrate-binding protein [Staphylococcus massiliensis]|uniref:Oligopeptide ABC transporter OppA oligopeptide-binding protein n=1 Tax=Staphylococcus massiliensis S46 TaxID=1229783 RepID=K9ALB3_9STAP|nr:peptide ABC transporter substrate-binding protein [Staphylococcus massiliensis]EKU48089.1 oligopeptide ABC transporter OppA oligopeptide-binding protein [Staphylococcus massiliensis S46]MCG3399975.1 peptide ABC transporter substrate-binding protein [Staphylococcus massiliensis]MCG3412136.1 peptide ABC transporter substrate-binding protein [Staphylococcus massiliensis]POA01230.1 peptide ABC transporter substrate-binding protein [Staphylococcus massiliensis CCUG 55927]
MAKKRKLFSMLLASTLVLSACSGSGGSKSSGNELKLMESADIPTMDPSLATDAVSFTQFNQVYEGLYVFDKDNKPVPGVAKGEPKKSKDGKTWTIELRDDAKWANGDPVTADDFVFSWRRTVNPETAAEYAYMFENIKNASQITERKLKPEELGVKAKDKHTLVIELEKDLPYMQSLLAFGSFLPENEKFVKEHGKKFGTTAKATLANGPFKLENWKNEDSWELVKNDKYHDKDKVKLDKVKYKVVKEAQTGLNMFETGDVDVVRSIPPESIDKYKDHEAYKTLAEPTVFFLRINQTKNKDLANKNLRLAISKAIDKDTFVKTNLNNGSKATDILTAKDFIKMENGKDYTDGVKSEVNFDVKEAQKYYEAAKKELGKDKFEIEFLTYDKDTSITDAEFIKGQIEKNLPGVKFKIKQLPFKQKLKVETDKDYDISYAGWGPDYPDPTTYISLFTTNNPHNQTGYSNPDYDQALKEADSDKMLKDPQKRYELLQKSESSLLEDGVIVPMYQRGLAQLIKKDIKNWTPLKLSGDYALKEVEVK